MVKTLSLMVLAIAICGCIVLRTDADGTPNKDGKYETKKVAGVTYSRQPMVSASAKIDAKIQRFLLIVAAVGLVGLIGGAVCWYADWRKLMPCPWWDELVAVSLITIAIALVSIKLYHIFVWIVLGGTVAYGGYLAYKSIKIKNTKGKAIK